VTIVFKHGKISGDPRSLQDLLHQFEVRHPNIRVRSEPLPSSTDQQHQIYAINLEGGASGIDVLAMDVIWIAEFARAGWIRPLDDLFEPGQRAEFFPNALEAATYRGKIWAVPWYIDAGVLYYRKDLLKKYGRRPPPTWEELVETVRVVLDGEQEPRLYGFIWQGRQYEGLICNALEFIWGNGGDVLRPDGWTDLTNPATVEAVAFMRDLIHTHAVSPSLVTMADEETSRHLFSGGRALFTRNWPYAWSLFEQEGSPVRGKVGVGPLPSFGGRPAASTLGGWHLGIAHDSRHPEPAWRFIEFLTSPEAQKMMARKVGIAPTRTSVYRDPTVVAAQPFLPALQPIFASARPRPVTPFYPMVSQILQSEFSAVLAGLRPSRTALVAAERELLHTLLLERL
jgi:multiple sugar transport system substrate-binding protein